MHTILHAYFISSICMHIHTLVPDNLSVFLSLVLIHQNLPAKSNFGLPIPVHKIQWSNRRALFTGGETG